jgi:hypothetical protein
MWCFGQLPEPLLFLMSSQLWCVCFLTILSTVQGGEFVAPRIFTDPNARFDIAPKNRALPIAQAAALLPATDAMQPEMLAEETTDIGTMISSMLGGGQLAQPSSSTSNQGGLAEISSLISNFFGDEKPSNNALDVFSQMQTGHESFAQDARMALAYIFAPLILVLDQLTLGVKFDEKDPRYKAEVVKYGRHREAVPESLFKLMKKEYAEKLNDKDTKGTQFNSAAQKVDKPEKPIEIIPCPLWSTPPEWWEITPAYMQASPWWMGKLISTHGVVREDEFESPEISADQQYRPYLRDFVNLLQLHSSELSNQTTPAIANSSFSFAASNTSEFVASMVPTSRIIHNSIISNETSPHTSLDDRSIRRQLQPEPESIKIQKIIDSNARRLQELALAVTLIHNILGILQA